MMNAILVGLEKGPIKLIKSYWGTVGGIVYTLSLIKPFNCNLRSGKLPLRDETQNYLIMSMIVCNFYILKMV